MLDGFSRSHVERRVAKRGNVCGNHFDHPDRRRSTVDARLGVDVEDIDPVAGADGVVIKQPPRTLWLFVQIQSAEERLPGVPDGLGYGKRAATEVSRLVT